MADRETERRWLGQLTTTPTAPGHEHRVLDWVENWVRRRSDLRVEKDAYGNLLITQKGRKRHAPVLAVAHTDHPGFVVTAVDRRSLAVEFRGGVRPEYFDQPRLDFFASDDTVHRGKLTEFDHGNSTGVVTLDRLGPLEPGDIGRWSFGQNRGGVGQNFALGHACDDLAGVAAALAALDRARGEPATRHLGVLLTRAEEVGFVGAIGAARSGRIPADARLLSIECSRSFPESPVGGGPIVRVGDATSVFDHELTNRIAAGAKADGIKHQRHLMAGGSCEATAFVAYGFVSTGLCLPIRNYHNMGYLDEVEQGKGMAALLPEVVSISDFHGLVDLLLLAVRVIDTETSLKPRLEARFEAQRWMLE